MVEYPLRLEVYPRPFFAFEDLLDAGYGFPVLWAEEDRLQSVYSLL